MTILRMLPGPHISEFSKGTDGRAFSGTCTQASAAMAYAAQQAPGMAAQQCVDLMISMRDAMYVRDPHVSATGCAANGAATIQAMAYELRQRGAHISQELAYEGHPLVEDWLSVIDTLAGVNPIILQVQNAQALADVYGHPEDAGVQNHAIYIPGKSTAGAVVGDPNNPTVTSTFDTYSYDALRASQPIGLIVLDPPATPLPAGWLDDGTALHFGSMAIPEPFRTQLLSLHFQIPVGDPRELRAWNGETLLTLANAQLRTDNSGAQIAGNIGDDWLRHVAALQAIQKEAAL